jgi:mono/diheme cytochrome c family protein
MMRQAWITVVLGPLALACGPAPAVVAGPLPMGLTGRVPLTAADAADMIESPSVVIDAAGTLHAVWASETAAGERSVLLASAAAGGQLGAPRPLARTGIFVAESTVGGRGGPPRTVRRPLRTVPHIARITRADGGEALVVVFTAAAAGDETSVRPLLMRSDDGGRSFSEPVPLGDAMAVRPTFTGCAVAADGRLLFSWLDHRLGVQVPALAATQPHTPSFLRETVLEESVGPRGVCPCCPTACAGDEAGNLFLAFRNHVDGFRDISVARRAATAERFTEVRPVVPPTWKFDGCPHDGPALDVHSGTITVGWMDAHTGTPMVYVASGRIDGSDFARPERLDPSSSGGQGNVRFARDTSGMLHAVWERSAESAAATPPSDAAGEAPRGRGGHSAHADPGGRLVMHARLVSGTWTAAKPLAPAADAIQTRPVVATGRDTAVAAAFFERTAAGKELVVLRSGTLAASGMANSGVPLPRPGLRPQPGRLVYLQHCAGCHGVTGGGDGPAAVALPQPPRAFAAARWRGDRTRAGIRHTILHGVPGTAMRPLTDMPDATVDAIVAHVAELAALGAEESPAHRLRVHAPPLSKPALNVTDTTGGRWTVADDAVLTVVHVWGASCGECLAEMPELEALARRFTDRGLRVVHLCIDATDAAEAGRIAAAAAPGARVLFDPSGRAAEQLQARLLPASRIIDRKGRIVASVDGRDEWLSPGVGRLIETLLADALSADD